MSNIKLHESFYRLAKRRTRLFVFVCSRRRNDRRVGVKFPLGVETVDVPEDDFAFAGRLGQDKVVVKFYAVDVVGVNGCGREVRVRIAFWEICGWWDGVGRGGRAGGLVV